MKDEKLRVIVRECIEAALSTLELDGIVSGSLRRNKEKLDLVIDATVQRIKLAK